METKKICSYCMEEDDSVDRLVHHGLCDGCYPLVKTQESVVKAAQDTNYKLMRGEVPAKCPCKRTEDQLTCAEMDCDGIYLWCKNNES